MSNSRLRSLGKLTALAIGLGLVALAVVTLLGRTNVATIGAEPIMPQGPDFHRNVTQLEVPPNPTIFGERIPMENWEVRERFEREFYYNYQNADQLVMWSKRSKRVFPMIDSMLRASGVPEDFAYAAIAESGLRNVKSPAKAWGFWQIVPGTAKGYGLRVDDYIDERLDPIKSTQAAIKYFLHAKSMFPSWTLVAASYNMGEENVVEALAWQHQTSYWNLFINDETMRYVLRIAAIKELMTNGEKYGLDFGKLHGYAAIGTKTVTLQGPIAAISDWAADNGYAYKDLKTLNPWIVGRNLPKGVFEVELPASDVDRTTTK